MSKVVFSIFIIAILLIGCVRIIRALITGKADFMTPGFNVEADRSVNPGKYWVIIILTALVLGIAGRAIALFGFSH